MSSRLIEYPYPEKTKAVGYRYAQELRHGIQGEGAVEAAKEQETLQELSARFEVSPGQISQWKRQLLEGAGQLFERANKKQKRERETEADRDRLPATVRKLTVENEFLKKSTASCTGASSDG